MQARQRAAINNMKPLTLRTKLTLFYSITVSVLLSGFGLVYYRVLSVGLDRDITQDVIDRTSGLRGYLRFEEGVFDSLRAEHLVQGVRR